MMHITKVVEQYLSYPVVYRSRLDRLPVKRYNQNEMVYQKQKFFKFLSFWQKFNYNRISTPI